MYNPISSKTQRQEEYVRESLTRAFDDIKLAKLEGRELQSVDDFLNELDEKWRNNLAHEMVHSVKIGALGILIVNIQ